MSSTGDNGNGDDPLKPGGALEGSLFRGFLKQLSKVREPEPGERFGPWRIRHELGRGGSGVVFLAERADGAFSQEVALKWLRGDRPAIGGFRGLERERELLASMDHPNIARLIDGGQTESGMLWFAMDLVSGQPLDSHCQDLPVTRCAELIRRLCQAVHHAHRRGLIHGDIKPSNVLVDANGNPRLLDFGIARLHGADGIGSYGLTPEFASPEQRDARPLTTASDVWQLGCLLQAVIGKHPVPRDLQSVIEQAMAEEPEQRYDSAAAMESDLAAWQARRPVSARGGGPAYRTACLIRRNLPLSALTMAALLVIVSGGVWMTWQLAAERDIARAEAERSEAALREAEKALARAEALREFLVGLFRAAAPDRPRDQLPSTAELLALGADRALDEEAAPDDERLGMLAAIGEVYMALGRWDEALELLEEAAGIGYRGDNGVQPGELARVLALKAHIHRVGLHLEKAEALLIEAEQMTASDDRFFSEFAHARSRRGSLAYMLGRNREGLELLEPLYEQAMERPDSVSLRTRLRLMETLGALNEANGALAESIRYRTRAVELARELAGIESRSHAYHLSSLASVQASQGLFDEAQRNLDKATSLYEQIYDRPTVIHAGAGMGQAELELLTGRYDQVPETLEAALTKWARARGRSFEQQTRSNRHYARMLLRIDRPEKAEPILARALEGLGGHDRADGRRQILTRAWLAEARCRTGRVKEGLALVPRLDDANAASADYHEARAVCLHRAGEYTEALDAIGNSLAEPVPPGHAMHRARRYMTKAEILGALDREEEADRLSAEARLALAEVGLNDHPVLKSPGDWR